MGIEIWLRARKLPPRLLQVTHAHIAQLNGWERGVNQRVFAVFRHLAFARRMSSVAGPQMLSDKTPPGAERPITQRRANDARFRTSSLDAAI